MSISQKQKKIRRHRVGEVSSKYAYQPELFERDLKQHAAESEALWQDFRAWMIERKHTAAPYQPLLRVMVFTKDRNVLITSAMKS